jgi:hypothetical protein
MKESHIEGLANHDDPESCGNSREAVVEALTGALTGKPLSREIKRFRVPTLLSEAEGHIHDAAIARRHGTLRGRRHFARTETFCTRTGRSLGSLAAEGAAGRIGKAEAVRR